MKLNPNQNEAVKYVSGPCLVLAGAGSGKTRVITNKIAYLVQQCGYNARNIAAVTFTNKAAREMKERVGQTLGRKEARGLMVSTFHTLGLEIIRREHKSLNLKANFSLFDDTDQLALLKELTEAELDNDKDKLSALISQISNWKNDLILPARAMRIARGPEEVLMAQLYERYHRQMVAYNALDFDDLIVMPTLLLKSNQEVRERWQNKIRYLLVDEYQDTNTSQYELVKQIVGERARFTVVGDDDQSIYSWRGAKPQNLVLLNEDFPSLKLIKLEQNYRSKGRILKCANILIANNPHVFDKALFSELDYGVPVKVLFAKNEEHEAERIAAENGGSILVTTDPREAVADADCIFTDTWVSMGEEAEYAIRSKPFWDYQVNADLMSYAKEDAIFQHCLPAYRGKEVTSEVIDGPQSVVWDEAGNRLHAQKALLTWLIGQQRGDESLLA